jgi:DHA1 family inner membrane transport protein
MDHLSRSAPHTKVQLFAALFACQATVLTVSPLLNEMSRDLSVAPEAVAQLRSITGLIAGSVAVWLATSRAPRSGLRTMLLVGLASLSISALGTAMAPGFGMMVAVQIPAGIGIGLVLSAGMAAAGHWSAPGNRSKVLAWTLAGQPAAWVVGQPLVGAAADVHWRLGWIVLPFLSSIVAIGLIAARPRPNEPADRLRLRSVVAMPGIRSWAIGELLAFSAWAGTLVFAGALFMDSHGLGVSATSLLLAGGAVFYVVGSFSFRKRIDRSFHPYLVGLALISALGVMAYTFVRPSTTVTFVLFSLLALMAGARTLAGGSAGLTLGEKHKLSVMSLRTAALQFGYLIGSVAGGIAHALGGYEVLGVTFASLFVGAAIVHTRTRPRPGSVSPADPPLLIDAKPR